MYYVVIVACHILYYCYMLLMLYLFIGDSTGSMWKFTDYYENAVNNNYNNYTGSDYHRLVIYYVTLMLRLSLAYC